MVAQVLHQVGQACRHLVLLVDAVAIAYRQSNHLVDVRLNDRSRGVDLLSGVHALQGGGHLGHQVATKNFHFLGHISLPST